ncbi:MAG TPA: hypothetical protein V6C85_10800 [Allocoleopsis sp.]
MGKTVSDNSACLHAYQQALADFGITQLLSKLNNYNDADFNAQVMNLEEQECDRLAALLIQRLTHSLNGKVLASYLNAIRHGDSDVIFDPMKVEIPPPSIELPESFPDEATPRYQEGDRVRWRPLADTTNWGVVIGRFYARHLCRWTVGYLIRLDRDSPSAAWTVADTAWEEDLEPNHDKDWEKASVTEAESFLPDRSTSDRILPPISLPSNRTTSPWVTPMATPEFTQKTLPTEAFISNGHTPPISRSTLLKRPTSLHAPPGTYDSVGRDSTNPRKLTQRERNLIELYSNCKLGMTPRRFYAKWSVTYEQLAAICSRSTSTVERWFTRGRYYQRPTTTDLRYLALMDFLLEHFEAIPSTLLNLLCSPNRK